MDKVIFIIGFLAFAALAWGGFVWLICWSFDWTFSWKYAFGAWLVWGLVHSMFSVRSGRL